ncbi:glyoxalase/bleomycin resistance/dioxygenase family protein [Streptomyces oryzae]|uniref:Glyoxalase/bleomycin resistance/dioxygenase family protein n=1 Tax=Streptomyces oryzae TaxID=1434886 RepID=A0ABS3XDT3_9ACTN|nr:glyoxalase/bleomycin resistance/dioxygenase family protein [Streptomyces oryzae]MBO8193549.1 glyoxalase/bleomycin resistance/dioxygenase family protein [Streptomyces oryzae]
MTSSPAGARMALVVLYAERLDECRRFYGDLGLLFAEERHGEGPLHYAATLPDGTVLELYPATERRPVSSVRLGFGVLGRELSSPLPPGRHVVDDPDGRAVELYVE